MKDIELIDHTLQRIAQYGDGEIEISTKHLEKICKLALEHLIEQSHKQVVMQGLPTEDEIKNEVSSYTTSDTLKRFFMMGARFVITKLSGSPTVADGAVGKNG